MQNKNIGIIVAIIVVGLLIGGAMIYGSGERRSLFEGESKPLFNLGEEEEIKGATVNVRPVSSAEHVRGSLEAPVIIVEYSDLECPFCKRFHETMNQVFKEYGPSGQVAWVYRHFPLDNLHAKARNEALATECAEELGGNEAFWSYLDKIFAVTPSNDGLDASLLPVLAAEIGLDRAAFEACLASNDFDAAIQADVDDATQNGGTGTPFPVIIGPDGKQTSLPGAVPFPQLKALIEAELAKVK